MKTPLRWLRSRYRAWQETETARYHAEQQAAFERHQHAYDASHPRQTQPDAPRHSAERRPADWRAI